MPTPGVECLEEQEQHYNDTRIREHLLESHELREKLGLRLEGLGFQKQSSLNLHGFTGSPWC